MAPLIMLAAQLYSKHKQQEEAKRQALIDIQRRRARELGGETYGMDAAQFNRDLKNQSFGSPEELMSIYGTLDGGDKKSSPYDDLRAGTQDDYGASNPTTPAEVAAKRKSRQSELMDPWEEDPYGLRAGY